MERVATGVEVVDDNLDDFILLQDKGVCVFAVYSWVVGLFAGAKGSVESGNLGVCVGDIVEEGVVGAVAEIIHDDVEFDGAVGLGEEFHAVVGFEGDVVEGV